MSEIGLMGAVDKMSYEFILKSDKNIYVLYDKINYVMESILMYKVSFKNEKATGYKIPWVKNSWGTDVEIFLSEEGVGLDIIIGNVGEITHAIEREMHSSQMDFTVEEI